MGGRCSACGKLTASKNLSGSGILASPTADAGAFLNLADWEPNDFSQSSSDLAAAAVATEAASALQLWSRSNLCLRRGHDERCECECGAHFKQKVFLQRPQGTATAAAPPLLSLQPASAHAAAPRAKAPAPAAAAVPVVWQPREMWRSTAALGSAPGAQGTSCMHRGQLSLTWQTVGAGWTWQTAAGVAARGGGALYLRRQGGRSCAARSAGAPSSSGLTARVIPTMSQGQKCAARTLAAVAYEREEIHGGAPLHPALGAASERRD
jgi:hypothetical protein